MILSILFGYLLLFIAIYLYLTDYRSIDYSLEEVRALFLENKKFVIACTASLITTAIMFMVSIVSLFIPLSEDR